LLRNLARSLRNELDAAAERDAIFNGDADVGMNVDDAAEEARKLAEARYGLPIPDSVLQEDETAAIEALRVSIRGPGKDAQGAEAEIMNMSDEQRQRAKSAFMAIEEKIGEVVMNNRGGIGQYLGECWGW
jgi:chromatin structure-remodeling complex subunit RSC9